MNFLFKKSIYFEDVNIIDYVFKGYTVVFKVDMIIYSVKIHNITNRKCYYNIVCCSATCGPF